MKKWLDFWFGIGRRLKREWQNLRQRIHNRMQTAVTRSVFSCLLVVGQELWETFRIVRRSINKKMRGQYSPHMLAGIVTFCCGIVLFFVLFIPPYLGIANDGTVSHTMSTLGLKYLEETGSNYNNYFVRVYQNVYPERGTVTVHILFVRLAKALDYLFTRDTLFDVRFLGALYSLLYLPGIYLLARSALERLNYFTESMVVSAATVIVFADVSFLTYFNSLYPEPLLMIAMIYLTGAAMRLQKPVRHAFAFLFLLSICALVMAFTRKHCFFVCLWTAAFLVLCIRAGISRISLLVLLSLAVFAGGFAAYFNMPDDFTATSQIHAMTRGVLLQSGNPEKTLKEFGIDGSYEILADVTLYDDMPVTEEANPLLLHGFLDKYTTADLLLYYLRHPAQFVSMLDLGVKSSVDLRRVYCGNYEKETGMPPRAQSPFWSAYSTYKKRSAPKTIGYLIILIGAFLLMSGRKVFSSDGQLVRFHYIYLLVMSLIALIGVTDLSYILIRSGDAQLTQFHFLPGVCMDLMVFYVLTEILYKLNILEQGKEAP